MMIKLLENSILFLLLTFSIVSGKQEKETGKLKSCDTIIIDSLFRDYLYNFRYVKELDQLTLDLNSHFCTITKEELKNMLINMYSKYKFDTTYTYPDKEKYKFSWLILLENWDERFERIVKNEMEYLKKKNDNRYYHRIWILTKHSENWFQYITDMYYNLDSIPPDYDFKSLACKVLIDKYGTSRNPVTLSKVESILYAIMLKDENKSDFKIIDKYLSDNSEKYKQSKQRKMFFERLEEKIIQENKMHKSYSDFITSVKEYFNKNKRLTDYEPPFKFD